MVNHNEKKNFQTLNGRTATREVHEAITQFMNLLDMDWDRQTTSGKHLLYGNLLLRDAA